MLARSEAEECGAAAAVEGRPELGDHEVAAFTDEADVDALLGHWAEVPRDGDGLAGGCVAEVVGDHARQAGERLRGAEEE
uniref:Uncharacterized protein n=1 Tax=Arundo donax TaxID=35708 RepID=A0A0A8ZDG7_ARUDO